MSRWGCRARAVEPELKRLRKRPAPVIDWLGALVILASTPLLLMGVSRVEAGLGQESACSDRSPGALFVGGLIRARS